MSTRTGRLVMPACPQKVLSFFRDVETMAIPDAPKVGAGFGQAEEHSRPSTRQDPWRRGGTITPTKTTFFTVHLGVLRKRAVVEGILMALAPDAPINEEDLANISGYASMGTVVLDWEGRIFCNQFMPAPFVFGVRRLRENKPLSNISEEMEKSSSENLGKRFGNPIELVDPFRKGKDPLSLGFDLSAPPQSGVPISTRDTEDGAHSVYERPATLADLFTISQSLLKVAGLPTDKIGVRVVAREVRRKPGKPMELPDFDEGMLPSFFTHDIDRVIKQGPLKRSAPLESYLAAPVREEDRVDILADHQAFAQALAPKGLTLGRWPSNPRHSLNVAQQAAVGRVCSAPSGIVAINGPPGTGKTTLLRDLVAQMVVKRALLLSKLEDPQDGMVVGTIKPLGEEQEPFEAALVEPALVEGTGVVVASSNNAAVENVSLALPTRASIDTHAFPEAAYLQPAARDLAAKMAHMTGASTDVWGLAALRLGNKENIRTVFKGLSRPFAREGEEQTLGGLVDSLRQKGPCDAHEWQQGVKAFHAKLACVAAMLVARDTDWADVSNRPVLEKMRDMACPLEEEVRAGLGWRWPTHWAVRAAHGAAKRALPQGGSKWPALEGWVFFEALACRLGRTHRVPEAQVRGWVVPDAAFFARPLEEVHRASVWTEPGLERARSDLFLAGLHLHELFLRANLRKLYAYLGSLRKVLTGDVRVSEAMLLQVWKGIFILSPVVSTTLASMRRLPLSHAWIGLLLVDEAGQATPQSVVGALARAQKAVLVGDPLQIEPVFSVPAPIVERLMEEGQVAPHFSPITESAQTVADGVMEMGAWIPKGAPMGGAQGEDGLCGVTHASGLSGVGLAAPVPDAVLERVGALVAPQGVNVVVGTEGDGFVPYKGQGVRGEGMDGRPQRVWTGMPLRVHRRCQEPMFGISNAISYGNQMVQGTPPAPLGSDRLPPSAWFDAWRGDCVGKVRTDEMALVRASLERMRMDPPRLGGAPVRTFVISPFVEVAEACREVAISVFGRGRARVACPTGTVHTFQGQEADVVFLVLGTAPGDAGRGARLWASGQANLLNVALTRARHRVYVVGRAEDWRGLSFFDRLYRRLEEEGRVVSYPRA